MQGPRTLIAGLLALAILAAAPSPASAGTYGDRLVAEGNDAFRTGNFFNASEKYRCAVLEEPADGMKKLQFGHALYALGNYAYAAYSFRRGLRYLGYPDDLRIELVQAFGQRLSYDRAIRDVRRYSAYFPSDPHALTVIAYISFFGGDRAESAAACKRLLEIDPRDSFAAYLQRRIELEGGGSLPPAAQPAPQRTQEAVATAAPPPQRATQAVAVTPQAPPRPATSTSASTSTRTAPAPSRRGQVAAAPVAPEPIPEGWRSDPALLLSDDDVAKPALAR